VKGQVNYIYFKNKTDYLLNKFIFYFQNLGWVGKGYDSNETADIS